MADDILELPHVMLTRFLGGTASRAGRRRPGTCYQITEGATYVELTPNEAIAVARHILRDAGMSLDEQRERGVRSSPATRIAYCAHHGAIDLDLNDDAGRLARDPRVPYGPRSACDECQRLKVGSS